MKARFNEIHDIQELDSLIEKSNDRSIVIFKHSTTCPISSGVYQEISKADADINLIVIQHSRPVSTAIAERTGIRHESPQAIILKNEKVIYYASHYDVTADEVEAHI